jgi:hypothetical protein
MTKTGRIKLYNNTYYNLFGLQDEKQRYQPGTSRKGFLLFLFSGFFNRGQSGTTCAGI